MRIGEFSKKYNITHDTVRHYIDIGLLIPKKDNHHYRFDETHDRDITKIIELKKLDFSLIEIQKILNFNRLAGKNSKEYTNYYLQVLEDKKKYVLECQKRYEGIESTLSKKIEDLASSKGKTKRILGIKIDSLDILYCPKCNESLNISDGNIENNMIINGTILCNCGYRAYIENGIYIGNNCGEDLSNKKEIPSKLDFMEYSSTGFINLFYDGMSKIIEDIKDNPKSPKYILELENCSGTFLMQYMEYLPEETTYILINRDKTRLEKLKDNLELNNVHDRFIFICEDFNCIPIKTNSIDLMIDHWMTKEYASEKKKFLLDKLSELMRKDGLLLGAYPYLTNKDTDIYVEELKEKGYLNFEFISHKLKELGFMERSITQIGPIIEDDPYNKDIKNRKLYLNIYSGIKNK